MSGSIVKNARVTSPGALATLVQAAAADGLIAGEYEVTAAFYFAGTAPVDGTDSDNVNLVVDNVTQTKLGIAAVSNQLQNYRFLVQTNGTNIKLVVNSAGTTGTSYDATIGATLVPVGTA